MSSQRASVAASILLAAGLVASCSRRPTGLVVAVGVEGTIPTEIDHLSLTVTRNGQERLSTEYTLPAQAHIPGTIVLLNGDDESAGDPITVQIHATGKSGAIHVDRRARLGFISEHMKLLRVRLQRECFGIDCSDPATTCDHGTCVPIDVDPAPLPDFTTNDDAIAGLDGPGGAAGAAGKGGASVGGTSGAAGTGGASGKSGAGGAAKGGAGGVGGGNSGSAGTGGKGGAGTGGAAGKSGSAGNGGAAGNSGGAGNGGAAGKSGGGVGGATTGGASGAGNGGTGGKAGQSGSGGASGMGIGGASAGTSGAAGSAGAGGQANTCGNGAIDPGESDVDCGGPCPKCLTTKACVGPSDCVTSICSSNVCSVSMVPFVAHQTAPVDPFAGGLVAPVHFALGDLNGDGALDFVSANYYGHDVSILLNDKTGTFSCIASNPIAPASDSNVLHLAIADLNGDGALDIAEASQDSAFVTKVSVLFNKNDGSGTFGAEVPTGKPGSFVELRDVNADGNIDMLILSGGSISVLAGNGTGAFSPLSIVTLANPGGAFSLVDLDGDGKVDLVSVEPALPGVEVFHGNGDGSFGVATPTSVGGLYAGAAPLYVSAGDLDGDGLADVVTADYNGGQIAVLHNAGGALTPIAAYTTLPTPVGVLVSDLDGDGHAEIVSGSHNGLVLRIFYNALDGTNAYDVFEDVTSGYQPQSYAVGDVDGNGSRDLVVGNEGADSFTILLAPLPRLLPRPFAAQRADIDSLQDALALPRVEGARDVLGAVELEGAQAVRLGDGAVPGGHHLRDVVPSGVHRVAATLDVDGSEVEILRHERRDLGGDRLGVGHAKQKLEHRADVEVDLGAGAVAQELGEADARQARADVAHRDEREDVVEGRRQERLVEKLAQLRRADRGGRGLHAARYALVRVGDVTAVRLALDSKRRAPRGEGHALVFGDVDLHRVIQA